MMSAAADLLDASILIVDDLQVDARLVESILRGAGYSCVTATSDPLAACDLHRKHRFDLVVLDVLMPGMDGFEVLAALHTIDPEIQVPVIMVTAEPDYMKRALEAGARDFIGKPVRMVELLSRVRNALERSLLAKDAKARGRMLERTLHERTDDLHEAEDRFRALVEQSITGIYIVEAGHFTYANPRLCEWLGYTLEELRDISIIDLVHEVDRERLIENRRRRDAGDHDALTATYRFKRRDGRILHLSVSAKMIELKGRMVLFGGAEDVTERVRAQELLLEAESQYRALAEQSIVGIYLVDRQQRILYANPKLREILGFNMEELVKLDLASLVVEEDHALIEETLQQLRAGETGSIAVSCRVRRKDGRVVHLSVENKIIELAGRKAAIGVVQDITERALAAQSLRESEEKYRLLWETTTDAVVLLADDMSILYANPSVGRVFGYSPHEVEGRDIAMLQPPRLRETHREAMRRYLATGERTTDWRATETAGLHREGHEIPIEIAFSHVAVGGKSIFAGFIRDISRRKRAQAALENANQRLRSLSERMLVIQEEERRQISRELHDDVGQSLLALSIGLHRLEKHVEDDHRGLLAECVAVTAAVQEKLHELSVQLHPPHLDQLGLKDALSWLVNRHREMTGMAIEFRFSGAQGARVPPAVEGACYRICQEALNNATRHARARRLTVELKRGRGRLEVSIVDDGVGFHEQSMREALLASGSLGLVSMEERARLAGGRLELLTSPGSGTRVTASFPTDTRKTEAVRTRERA